MKTKTIITIESIAILIFSIFFIWLINQITKLGEEVRAADFKIDIIKEPYDRPINKNSNAVLPSRDSSTASKHSNVNSSLATVTAYSELDSCSNPKCIMANGKSASEGSIACPRKLKLGSKVEIEGKIYVCSDRTALKFDGRYDIWMGYGKEGHDRAIKWGKMKLEVRLIK